MYDFRFEFDGGQDADARALSSMYRWLRQDPDLCRELDVELVSDPRPGQMGAVDVLSVVLTQLTGIGGLAVAVAGCRSSSSARHTTSTWHSCPRWRPTWNGCAPCS
jgi:hypothetical protein